MLTDTVVDLHFLVRRELVKTSRSGPPDAVAGVAWTAERFSTLKGRVPTQKLARD
jgi:hypothetical protein